MGQYRLSLSRGDTMRSDNLAAGRNQIIQGTGITVVLHERRYPFLPKADVHGFIHNVVHDGLSRVHIALLQIVLITGVFELEGVGFTDIGQRTIAD